MACVVTIAAVTSPWLHRRADIVAGWVVGYSTGGTLDGTIHFAATGGTNGTIHGVVLPLVGLMAPFSVLQLVD